MNFSDVRPIERAMLSRSWFRPSTLNYLKCFPTVACRGEDSESAEYRVTGRVLDHGLLAKLLRPALERWPEFGEIGACRGGGRIIPHWAGAHVGLY